MTSTALVSLPEELRPNPLPYGRLSLRKGAWDQLQAQRAYEDGDERHPDKPLSLDKKA
jgi:hypothetical protein